MLEKTNDQTIKLKRLPNSQEMISIPNKWDKGESFSWKT